MPWKVMDEKTAFIAECLRRELPTTARCVQQRDPKRCGRRPPLRRRGLSQPRRRQRRAVPMTQPFLPVHEANDLWCSDFKSLALARTGCWFRTADRQRFDPLTTTDADSRFLIECGIVPETIEAVQPVVDQAFCELGRLTLGRRPRARRPPRRRSGRRASIGSATISTTTGHMKHPARRRRPAATRPSPRPYPDKIEEPQPSLGQALVRC
jgi:hypothetical protein